MTFFLREKDDEVLEGNRYYWKIRKILQDIPPRESKTLVHVELEFKLHGKTWQNLFVDHEDGFVYIDTCSLRENHFCDSFDIRTGIVGDDQKEIAAVKVDTIAKLITRSELDSILLSNKVLYLFTEVRRKDGKIQKMEDRKERIQTDYRDLLLSGKNSDVTLEVKNKKFYCHRCILAARSPVFAAMIQNDIAERTNFEMIIEDAEPTVVQQFLLFLYTGKEDYLSWQNVSELYKLADKYGVEEIKSICRNDIKENIWWLNQGTEYRERIFDLL